MRPSLVKAGAVKGLVGLQIEQLEPGQPVQGWAIMLPHQTTLFSGLGCSLRDHHHGMGGR